MYTGYYFVFMFLLFTTFIVEKDTNDFCWHHMVLLIYAASMMAKAIDRYIQIKATFFE